MTEEEIEEMMGKVLEKLNNDYNWDSFFDYLKYLGELDGYHYWNPDNINNYDISAGFYVKVNAKNLEYSFVKNKQTFYTILEKLKENNPEYFTEQAYKLYAAKKKRLAELNKDHSSPFKNVKKTGKPMSEKEIEETGKKIMQMLKEDDSCHSKHDIIFYYGELDGYQYWQSDNSKEDVTNGIKYYRIKPQSELYSCIYKNSRRIDLHTGRIDLYRELHNVLQTQYPQYFSEETWKKRFPQKAIILQQIEEEKKQLLPKGESARIVQKLKDNGDWDPLFDVLHYFGELDGYQYWKPDNSERYSIYFSGYIKVDPRNLSYFFIKGEEQRKIKDILKKKHPEYFSRDAWKKLIKIHELLEIIPTKAKPLCKNAKATGKAMSEEEIAEKAKNIMNMLKEDGVWDDSYDTIYYIGEMDGYQYWFPDNSEMDFIMNHSIFRVNPRNLTYCKIVFDTSDTNPYQELTKALEECCPDFYTEEAIKKRNWKKEERLRQMDEYFKRLMQTKNKEEADRLLAEYKKNWKYFPS